MGCDMITGLKRLEGENYKSDIAFMDPPYHHGYERPVLDHLSRSPMVTEDTLTTIEVSGETDFGWLEESGWHMIRGKEYETSKHVFVDRGEQMRTVVYPGGFDPVILGHYDITKYTAKMMNKLIIGALNNKAKCSLPSAQGCANMLWEATASLSNVEIQSFESLLTDSVRGSYVDIVARGLWVVTGFEYGLQTAQANRIIVPEIDTIFLTTNLKYSCLSSSIAKEITEYEGDINEFFHPVIAARVGGKLEKGGRLI